MYLNKSTIKILQLFAGHITESYTLREVARILNMNVSLAHRAIQPLVEYSLVQMDKHKNLSLIYKNYHETLAFVESLRRDELLSKGKYKDLKLFTQDIINKIKEDNFVLLLFGSIVESDKPRDIDILLIVDNADKVEFHEKFLHNIASNYDFPFEKRVKQYINDGIIKLKGKAEHTLFFLKNADDSIDSAKALFEISSDSEKQK